VEDDSDRCLWCVVLFLHASVWWRRRWDIILVCAPFSLVVVLVLIQIHSPSLDWGVEISRTTMEREVFQVPTLIFLIEGFDAVSYELSRVTRWFSSMALLCVITTQILERVTQWSRNDPPTTSWRSESLPSQTTIHLNARDTDVLSISLAAPYRRSPDIHVATQLFTGTHTHTYTTSYLITRSIRVWLMIYSMNPMINAIRSNDRMKWFSVVRGVRERRGVPSIGAWWVGSLVDALVTQGPSLLQWPASISSTPYTTYVYYIHLAISILLSSLLLLFDFLRVVCGYCVWSLELPITPTTTILLVLPIYYYYYLPLVVE